MKKICSSLAALSLVLFPMISEARIVGTAPTNPDAFCVQGQQGHVGGSQTGAEVCVDASGNFVPTVTNAQALGSSALAYSNAFVQSETVSGVANVGILVLPSTTVSVVTATVIPVTSTYEKLLFPSGTVTSTASPEIVTAGVASGTVLILSSLATSGSIILSDQSLTAGSGLALGTASLPTTNTKQRTIGPRQTLTLIYDKGDGFWRELSYVNNN